MWPQPVTIDYLDLTPPDNYEDLQIWLRENFELLKTIFNYQWKDKEGVPVEGTAATKPTWAVYRTPIYQWQFGVGDETTVNYHMPHDWVFGSDMFIHVHWSHISAAVTGGTVTFDISHSYSKGFAQGAGSVFPAPKTLQLVANAAGQYEHVVSEIQLSSVGGSATEIDTDDLQVDGNILANFNFAANNMTGATPNIFIHFCDIHYLSWHVGTTERMPDFYT